MMRTVRIRLTGLTAIVRRRKGASRRSHVMDAILVRPRMVMRASKMGMPAHYPTLIAPKGMVMLDPPGLLTPADPKLVAIPKNCEAWSLEGFELRFPHAPSRQHRVHHQVETLKLGHDDVTGHEFDNFDPLSSLANASEAANSRLDAAWLGAIQGAGSPVAARVRFSGGSIACTLNESSGSAFWYWQLKDDHRASGGRPLAEIVTLTYPLRGKQTELALDVVPLSKTTPAGSITLQAGEFEVRNFPGASMKVPNRRLDHFDAFYELLKNPKRRPLPFFWGELTFMRKRAMREGKLVLAVESGAKNAIIFSGGATCPLTVMEN